MTRVGNRGKILSLRKKKRRRKRKKSLNLIKWSYGLSVRDVNAQGRKVVSNRRRAETVATWRR